MSPLDSPHEGAVRRRIKIQMSNEKLDKRHQRKTMEKQTKQNSNGKANNLNRMENVRKEGQDSSEINKPFLKMKFEKKS